MSDSMRAGGSGRLRLMTALAAVLLACLLPAGAARAGQPFSFGFYDNAPAWDHVDVGAADSAWLGKRVGSTLHRISVRWDAIEPADDAWRIDFWDRFYRDMLAQGVRPVFNIGSAPDWARDPSISCEGDIYCNYPPLPEHLGSWRDLVRELLTRYPNLGGLEIWNEPNLQRYWQSGPDPAFYTRLVKEATAVKRELGSSVPILAGNLSNYPGPDTAENIGTASFLDAMYRNGIVGHVDGISIHPYPDDIDLWRTFKTLSEVEEVRDVHGDETPLWVGELGVTTSGDEVWAKVSENDQGVLLQKLIGIFRRLPDVRGVLVNTLYEPTQWGMESRQRGFGVIRPDGRVKPAYCAIAAANYSSYQCPLLVKKPVADPTQAERWRAQELLQEAANAARRYHVQTGAYAGLTTQKLHQLDPELSPHSPDPNEAPGGSVSPWEVGVWTWVTPEGQELLLLCNASRADRSYCIFTSHRQPWIYGGWLGTISQAANAITRGWTRTW